ncbi:MAG TPA: CHASE2 domain-containing protein [Bryobacteraceae bacterium]|jgi:CHASE2 domain-containing sensor protein
MCGPPEKPPLRRVYAKGLIVMALIAGAVWFVEKLGWLYGLETAGLDTFVRQEAGPPSDRIYIVKITDDDYARYFKSTSPLDAQQLGTLIQNVVKVNPAVIGIDVDTSDPRFQPLADRFRLDREQRVVWARVPQHVPSTPIEAEEPLGALTPVMGRDPRAGMRFGVPLFPFEPDGAVRRYRRTYESSAGPADSLPWSVVKTIPKPPPHGGDEVILKYRGRDHFPALDARQFLDDFHAEDPRWKLLNDKIVLIGGSYSAARDEYATAIGRIPGVELIATAVEGDLMDDSIREFSAAGGLAMELAIGSLVVLLFYYSPSIRIAFWLSVLITIALAVGGSKLLFRSATYWVNFVPILVGMIAHQLIDHGERHRELQHELHEACAEIKKLERELEAKSAEAAPPRPPIPEARPE